MFVPSRVSACVVCMCWFTAERMHAHTRARARTHSPIDQSARALTHTPTDTPTPTHPPTHTHKHAHTHTTYTYRPTRRTALCAWRRPRSLTYSAWGGGSWGRRRGGVQHSPHDGHERSLPHHTHTHTHTHTHPPTHITYTYRPTRRTALCAWRRPGPSANSPWGGGARERRRGGLQHPTHDGDEHTHTHTHTHTQHTHNTHTHTLTPHTTHYLQTHAGDLPLRRAAARVFCLRALGRTGAGEAKGRPPTFSL